MSTAVTPALQHKTARVLSIERVTPKILLIRFRMEDPTELPFRAGQFIQVLIAPRIMRQYSLTSAPSEKQDFLLCVDDSPVGEGSRYMDALKLGDVMPFRGPFGVFTVPETETRPVELVATGAGIAPIRSIILDRLPRTIVPLRLVFGNRSEEFLFFHEEFLELTQKFAHFTYVPTLSQPSDVWEGFRGRVTDILAHETNSIGHPFYLCGNAGMIDDMRKVLATKGVPEGDVHFEKFF